jgi:hypothetical protein
MMQHILKFKRLLLKPKPGTQFNEFKKFFTIHINHLTQLGLINIILKCQEKTYVKKFTIFTTI